MNNAKVIVPVLAVLVCVSLSCTFLKERFVDGGGQAKEFNRVAKLPRPDVKTPPSPGALVIRRLAEMDTSVAPLAEQFESSERRAIQKVVDPNSLNSDITDRKEKALSQSGKLPLAFANPSSMLLQTGPPALPGINDGAFVGMLTGSLKSMLAGVQAGDYHKRDNSTEVDKETGVTSVVSVELDVGEDGSTAFGVGINSESIKNGVKVTTEMQAKIDGQDCPNAEGQLPITVKMHLSGQTGDYAYTQDITAFVRIVVDDNADIATISLDTTNGTSRGKIGQQSYGEFGATISYVKEFANDTVSNVRTIQQTDNLTQKDATEMSDAGYATAIGAVVGAVQPAKRGWQNGGCIKIEANSPGTVEISSKTSIPVKVIHKKDGSEITAKLDGVLSGETSIDPTLIPKTAGTLTYVAPGEIRKSATIKLTATSRRGKATLDLTASTGGQQYTVSDKNGPVTFSGQICSLDKAFVIDGKFANGSETQSFTPSSSTGGTVKEQGNSGGCTNSGGGSYTVTLNEQGSGELQWTESIKSSCPPYSVTNTVTFKVPLKPASGLTCP